MSEQIVMTRYTCRRCGEVKIVGSPFKEDAPEGIFITIRKVTEAGNHFLTDEIYTCSKECAVAVVQYGITSNSVAFRPVGRKR